jgi:hypothetical protein
MNLTLDTEKFDERQEIFVEEIVRSIATKLVEAGLEGLTMENLTAEIAFSVASILDDTTHIENDGVEVKPYLTFRASDDEIVHCGENAYTYEIVTPTLNKLFPPKG